MKTILRLACVLAALLLLAGSSARADEEQDLIGVLQSNASLPSKAEACKRLRLVGSARSVPALASVLGQERLSQAARYALEGIPAPEATAALRQALATTSGPLRTGVMDSLGWLHDAEAVPQLAPLLKDADAATAGAAAAALARIGGTAALSALETARNQAPPAVRPAVVDGLLVCAQRLAGEGQTSPALGLFKSLAVPTETEPVRVAAYAGWMRVAGKDVTDLVLTSLRGTDPAAQTAALQSLGELTSPAATRALVELLPTAAPGLQTALLAVLREREGDGILPAAVAAARSSDGAVRFAALQALGFLGDASVIPLLAEAAAATNILEQSAARESLATLRRGNVTVALAAQIEGAVPAVQRELLRALSARSDPAAVPPLLALARSDRPATRAGVLQALGQLMNGTHLEALVRLLVDAPDAAQREEVQGVFETLVERFGEAGALPADPIVKSLATASPAARQALFPVAALFSDDRLRAALRAGLQDPDATLREAAARAMASSRDAGLLPDLLEFARATANPKLRTLALEGAARLATDDTAKLTPAQRAEALGRALALAQAPEDKRLVLASLAQVPHRTALDLAERAGGDPAVRAEAEAASLRIARTLAATDFAVVEPFLSRLATGAATLPVRTNALALLKSLDSGWLCVGPYRQDGKRAEELFDIAFAPEKPDADKLGWRRAPGTADLTRTGEVDLGGITGGDQCVVYAKTRVYVPEARGVSFAIGSDDGIKLWVNGTLVHSNNAVRGLTPGQDRAQGKLRAGWNDLLAKVTQSSAGCGLSLRILAENGGDVPGLRLDAAGAARE